MHFENRLVGDGISLKVKIQRRVYEKIDKTHFVGEGTCTAGNFSKWFSLWDLLSDEETVRLLLEDAEDAQKVGHLGESVLEVESEEIMGWSWTDRRSRYSLADLEPFTTAGGGNALRVRGDRVDLTAPKTNVFTIVFKYFIEHSERTMVITSIYPGEDCGNITENESLVFFAPGHPGV